MIFSYIFVTMIAYDKMCCEKIIIF